MLGLGRRRIHHEAAPAPDGLIHHGRCQAGRGASWQFTDIHLHYVVTGKDMSDKKVEKAIELSQNKYCSVAATIRGVAKITYSFEVKNE
ncbi:MAG: OsmC family protein [Desulfobacterales bacterium]|nr:OsmC family protein [Desulfobacterales bacterium]